jgi:tetratricopeptide (TPR) repeat protein
VRQNLDYDYPIARGANPEVVVSFLLLAGLVWAAVWLLKRNRLLSFGVFLFFLGLSVESFVVQNDVIFEHRLYLPMIGACLFLSGGAVWLLRRRAAAAAVLGVCVIALGAAAHARNEIWSNELVLWEDVVQKSPGKARPHLNLAVAYHEKGQTEKAIEHFRRALEIQPDRALTYYNLAASQKKAGRADEAIQSYEKAIELKPDFAEAYNNLAILRAARGDFQEATDLLERAVQLKPNYEDARVNLAKLSARRG